MLLCLHAPVQRARYVFTNIQLTNVAHHGRLVGVAAELWDGNY